MQIFADAKSLGPTIRQCDSHPWETGLLYPTQIRGTDISGGHFISGPPVLPSRRGLRGETRQEGWFGGEHSMTLGSPDPREFKCPVP